MKKVLLIAILCVTSSCQTVSPLGGKHLNPNDKKECIQACEDVGMTLGAFVIISGRSGCVCEQQAKRNLRGATASSVGGAIAAIQAYQQKQKSQQANQQNRSHSF